MLLKIEVKPNTAEWHEIRKGGIGASDVPILTGESEYSNPIKLFYQKIGLSPSEQKESELMFWGHAHEPLLLDHWQYWEKEKDAYIRNVRDGKIVRRYKKNTGFIYQNEDYPFMFFTPDGIIPAGELTLYEDKLEKDCPLQAKNINALVHSMYGGLPPTYIEQEHAEMIVMGVEYSEFVYLVGGCQFYVEACPFSEIVAKSIIGICRSFWYDKVVPGKVLAQKWHRTTTQSEKDAIMADIHQLEPPPDSSEKYRAFLTERFVNRDVKVKATPQMEYMMHAYEVLKSYEQNIQKAKRLISNTLLMYHEHNGVSRILGENCMSSMNKKHIIKGELEHPVGLQIAQRELRNLVTV